MRRVVVGLLSAMLLASSIPANELLGTINWADRSELGTLVSGVVATVSVVSGQRVAPGEELLRLDDRGFKARVSEAQALVSGSKVRYDEAQREILAAQDYLTSLIELDPSGTSAEVIGPMIDYVAVGEDNRALIERLAQTDIRIVSLTVTEGGYYIDPASSRFDAAHPDVIHDAENPSAPRTAFGAIIAWRDGG